MVADPMKLSSKHPAVSGQGRQKTLRPPQQEAHLRFAESPQAERLQKVLAHAGVASRRHAEALIQAGDVSVNGSVVTTLGVKVNPEKDQIRVQGRRISLAVPKVYVMLNKPRGYITSRHDPEGRPTVMDLVADIKTSIYPVGRLDFNTEGLLLLTNDGSLAADLMHPRSQIEKTYWVKVSGRLTEGQIEKVVRGGITLSGTRTAPCRVQRLRETDENSWLEIKLHEGKNREIRHVMQKIGHPVSKIKRVAYAFLTLGNLPLGGIRFLAPHEVERLGRLLSKRSESAAVPPPLRSARPRQRSKVATPTF